jgi:hypothetical protein
MEMTKGHILGEKIHTHKSKVHPVVALSMLNLDKEPEKHIICKYFLEQIPRFGILQRWCSKLSSRSRMASLPCRSGVSKQLPAQDRSDLGGHRPYGLFASYEKCCLYPFPRIPTTKHNKLLLKTIGIDSLRVLEGGSLKMLTVSCSL